MKYIVNVADHYYEVEIEDTHARPIIARVDGQEFKVNPEDGAMLAVQKEKRDSKPVESSMPPASLNTTAGELTAPLPGTVIEIFVKSGEYVESGQVLFVIEAMKMKNSIRSIRAGRITDVLVSAGETVAHKQTLVRFG